MPPVNEQSSDRDDDVPLVRQDADIDRDRNGTGPGGTGADDDVFDPRDDRWWSRFRVALKEAFHVEDAAAFEPTEREAALVEQVCETIVRRRMASPAEIFLETVRPLNYVGAQVLHFLAPFAGALVQTPAWNEFAELLERRGSIEYLLRRIEELDRAAEAARRAGDAADDDADAPALPAVSGADSTPNDSSDADDAHDEEQTPPGTS